MSDSTDMKDDPSSFSSSEQSASTVCAPCVPSSSSSGPSSPSSVYTSTEITVPGVFRAHTAPCASPVKTIGGIHGENNTSSPLAISPPKSSPNILSREQLVLLFEASRAIHSEINPKETINVILKEAVKVLNCDRCALYVYDEVSKILLLSHSSVQLGENAPVRLKPGVGVAGNVFLSERVVRIDNCSKDERFNSAVDRLIGYKTHSLLTCPVFDKYGHVVAVLQGINKKKCTFSPRVEHNINYNSHNHSKYNKVTSSSSSSCVKDSGMVTSPSEPCVCTVVENLAGATTHFTYEDEALITHFALFAGVALRNAAIYKEAVAARDRASGLLVLLQSLRKDLGIQSALLTLTTHAKQLVQAEHCTVFLVDSLHSQLWSISNDTGVEIRQPLSHGSAGACASTGRVITSADTELIQQYSKKNGSLSEGPLNMLCVPIMDECETKVIGVIEVVNKNDDDREPLCFTEEDVRILEIFGRVVGPKLEASDLGAIASKKASTEAGLASFSNHNNHFENMFKKKRGGMRNVLSEQQIIREDDEAEIEDDENEPHE